jgi:hypothetical protein
VVKKCETRLFFAGFVILELVRLLVGKISDKRTQDFKDRLLLFFRHMFKLLELIIKFDNY